MNPETSRMVTIRYSDSPKTLAIRLTIPKANVDNHGDCETAEIVEREIPEHENVTPGDHEYPTEHTAVGVVALPRASRNVSVR